MIESILHWENYVTNNCRERCRVRKHIAIITIESQNYGNRLQNYALQNILKSMGCTVETIHRVHGFKEKKQPVKRLIQNIFQLKSAKFRQFDSLIDFSSIVIGRDDYPADLPERFDYFIAGSDQIWNPYYDCIAGKCDFLTFAKDNQKISYAASFGVSEIPTERKKEYAEYLRSFKAISVREDCGANIVKDLSGREATVVLDPTLLLDESEWRKVEKKSRFCPKHKYIFVYALGEKNDNFKKKIKQMGEKYIIFDIGAVQRNGRALPAGPSEFLYLLRNAEMILTDSFHATVFSILFHKKFITFNRQGLDMSSRIESLAGLVGEKKCINKCGDWDCEPEMDYAKVDAVLREERKKSIEFLEKALTH